MLQVNEQSNPLSKGRMLLLFLNYFVGYNALYPILLRNVTLWLDPTARMIPGWLQLLTYVYMIMISVWLGWPLLKESIYGIEKHKHHVWKTCICLLIVYYLCSLIVNLVIMQFSDTITSANQSQVVSSIKIAPLITLFSTLIYAPVVEEVLFRGVFFRCIRPYMKLIPAAIISALSFGFIHVMDSLWMGNYADLVYVFSYGLIGFFLALAYEKTESIYGSMTLHFMNNAVAFLLITV